MDFKSWITLIYVDFFRHGFRRIERDSRYSALESRLTIKYAYRFSGII